VRLEEGWAGCGDAIHGFLGVGAPGDPPRHYPARLTDQQLRFDDAYFRLLVSFFILFVFR
jgi:hypothetical protein